MDTSYKILSMLKTDCGNDSYAPYCGRARILLLELNEWLVFQISTKCGPTSQSVYKSYTCTKAEYNINQEQDNKKKDG